LRKVIRITETGTSDNPLVLIAKVNEENKKTIRFDCSAFRDNCYFRFTKKQCERLGNFLLEFSKMKK
jgi:hypothetical protein